MNACRVEFVFLVVLALAAAEAQAQQPAAAPAKPLTITSPNFAPAEPQAWHQRVEEVIEVKDLKPPTPESAGTLDAQQGGLGPFMWDGAGMATVRKMVPQIPAQSGSVVLRDLARRLLLSTAPAPSGPEAPPAGQPSLLELRVERLLAIGDIDGALALGRLAVSSVATPGLKRSLVDAQLLSGDAAAACQRHGELPAGMRDAALAEIQVFCHYQGGRSLEGNLSLDLLREAKGTSPVFIAAAEAMAGLTPTQAPPGAIVSPATFAALRATKTALPADLAATAFPSMLRAMIGSANATPGQRLLAAERAEAEGIVAVDALKTLYAEHAFTPQELALPPAEGVKAAGAFAQAWLFRAVTQAADPAERAALIARALTLADEAGRFAQASRLFAGLLAEVPPVAGHAAHAPAFAKALLVLGRPEAAAKWQDVLGETPHNARLWPLARLAAVPGAEGPGPQVLKAWRAAASKLAPEAALRRQAVLFALLTALGDRVPDEEWAALMEGPLLTAGPAPGAALWHMLEPGPRGPGAVVLAALVSLGEGPLAKADPVALARAVRALAAAGFDKEARRLAIEAALAAGA